MKRILILSGKGGTGKTTTAAAFIHFSKTKAIADCDVDAPNLHIVINTSSEPEKKDFNGSQKAIINPQKCINCGLCQKKCRFNAIEKTNNIFQVNEYYCEGCGTCEYLCPEMAVSLQDDVAGQQLLFREDKIFSTARLKMGRGNSGKLVTAVKMDLLKNAPETDIAIIDGSPGIGCPVISSISGMDLVLVVSEPSLSGLSDLKRLVKSADTFNTPLAVCVNKWDINPENTKVIEQYCKSNNILFAGKIPYDKSASIAVNNQKSISDIDCPAKDALWAIYQYILKFINN